MRSPGPPCQYEGQYCWQGPVSKKYYWIKTSLRTLVINVEQGGILETHDDVLAMCDTAICRKLSTPFETKPGFQQSHVRLSSSANKYQCPSISVCTTFKLFITGQ
ncbi:uncharacterized protein AKAW2_31476A [Aspergillus luchuensis]|uniref:Uncharacterized protein n=1 Tax=Aspergillus kawachii TaxID=1069201 RepID=A0A7R7W852_ASPKA|nr:uncharacterized protein AKAW2_31476A [Aspergillus luchuensis]BCR98157.1 hypothetical protein AKAW2_31476A [Aspergillus luchuensis]